MSALAMVAVLGGSVPGLALVEKRLRPPLVQDISKTAKVYVDASQIVYDSQSQIATATGKVELKYGPYRLSATKVVFNRKTNVLTANGSVVLKEPRGNFAEATMMQIDTAFREGFARHLRALLTNDVTITADYAVRREGRYTTFEQATYTACRNCATRSGKPLWQLVSSRTVHDDQEKTLAHSNARLEISGVPIAYFPYIKLPDPSVKRRTGFLPPSFKGTDYSGMGIVAPFFWAPAPNYDVTLKPWMTLKRGPVADVEWRHRLNSGRYNIHGYGVGQLNPGGSLGALVGEDYAWRGAVTTEGRFSVNKDWNWGWDGVVESDTRFMRQYMFGSDNIGQNDVFLTGLWDQTYISSRAMNFLPMAPSVRGDQLPFALPYLTVEHTLDKPVLGGTVDMSFNGYSLLRNEAYTVFDSVNHGKQQTRLVSQAKWTKENTLKSGVLLTEFVKLRDDIAIVQDLPDPTLAGIERGTETTHRVLPSAGFDVRLPLTTSNSWGTHIVTPVAQLIAARDDVDGNKIGNEDAITLNFDHSSLFLEDRFTGLDQVEGGVRANAGFTYNLLRDDGSFVRASIGESFHLLGENSFGTRSGLDGSASDIVAGITVSPFEGVSFNYEGRVEEDLSAINRQEASLGLSFDRFSANAGYLFIDKEPAFGRSKTQEYATANTRIKLSDGWFLSAGMNYDLQDYFFRSRSVGIEFDCDCMNAKLSFAQVKGKDNVAFDNRVMFSLTLATLGGTSYTSHF